MNIQPYINEIKRLGDELDSYISQPWNVIELIISQDYKSDFLTFTFDSLRKDYYDVNIILCKERIVKEDLYRTYAKLINSVIENIPKTATAAEKQQLINCAVMQNGYVLIYLSKYNIKKHYNTGYSQLLKALKIVPEEIYKLSEDNNDF